MGLNVLNFDDSVYCPECFALFNIGYSHAHLVWCLTHIGFGCSRTGTSTIIKPPVNESYVQIPRLWCIKCKHRLGWVSPDRIRVKFTHTLADNCGEYFYMPVAKFMIFV